MFARLRLPVLASLLFLTACGSGPSLDELARTGRHAEIVEQLADEDRLTPLEALQLGEAYLELNDLDAATREFNLARVRAGHTSPIAFRALFGLGNVSMLRRDGQTALFYFGEAREHAPTTADEDSAEEALTAARELLESSVAPAAGHAHEAAPDFDAERWPRADIPSDPEPFESTLGDPPAPAGRGLIAPVVLSRKAWGARAMIRSEAEPMNGVMRITVHHTGDAKPVKPATQSTDARRMRAYQSFHMDTRKWADIGYHYLIDPSGRIWEGRSIRWQGAHAGNGQANRHNVGISMMGNFEVSQPNTAQRTTLKRLVRWLVREYRVPARGLFTHQAIEKVYKLDGTACPGKHLIRYLDTLRAELRNDFALFSPASTQTETASEPTFVSPAEAESSCGCCGDPAEGGAAQY